MNLVVLAQKEREATSSPVPEIKSLRSVYYKAELVGVGAVPSNE
jgi:hypothetical protein